MTKMLRAAIANDNRALDASFSTSQPYRMRFPHHIKEAAQFVENLLISNYDRRREFNELFKKASESEKYRLYDLKNETLIRNGEVINEKAAEFALSQQPDSLTQFVINYQFYRAWVTRIS